jgi:hypothetical protein
MSQQAQAQTQEIPYEGVLEDGASPANGSYCFNFTLADDPTTPTEVWSSGSVLLTVAGGRFAVSLGAGEIMTEFTNDDWVLS